MAKIVSKQTETSRFQVCYTNTRTVDIEVKELPGTISNMGNDTENEKNDSLCDTVLLSPIPIFSRIWSVDIDQTGTMFCSCKHFERIGLPCAHMACVLGCTLLFVLLLRLDLDRHSNLRITRNTAYY